MKVSGIGRTASLEHPGWTTTKVLSLVRAVASKEEEALTKSGCDDWPWFVAGVPTAATIHADQLLNRDTGV